MTIDNNFIYDLTTTNYSASHLTWNPFGIRIIGGSNLKIYHNTVNLAGSQPSIGSTGTLSAALLINTSTITGLDIRNNIFMNSLVGVTGSKSYAIFMYSTSPSGLFNQLNYNIYYASGTYGVLGAYGTGTNTDITSISALQTATTKDANSQAVQTYLVSDTDLHLNGTSVADNRLYCPPITGIIVDFDNESRKTSNTAMGADEVKPMIGFSSDLSFSPDNAVYCNNASNVTMSFTPALTGFADGISRTVTPDFSIRWYKDGNVISGVTGNSNTINPITPTDAGNYRTDISYAGATATSITKNIYVETPMSFTLQPSSADVCSSDPTLILNAGATGTITKFQWQKENPSTPGTFTDIVGQNSSQLTIVLADPSLAIGNYRLNVNGPGNCGPGIITSNTINVNVTEPITNMQTLADVDPKNVCTQTTFHLTAKAKGTILAYQWQKMVSGNYVNLPTSDYPSANTSVLQIRNSTPGNSGKYRCLITGSPKCHLAPVPTPDLDVTVWPLFTLDKQPQGKLTCKNDSVALIVLAEGTIYKYQWRKDGVDLNPSQFMGSDGPMMILTNMQYESSGAYTCVLTIQDCSGIKDVESQPALVYIVSETKITSATAIQPEPLGATAAFEVRAHVVGAPIEYQPDIQWYRGNTPLRDNSRIAGTKSSILTITDLMPFDYGDDYKVLVTGICGLDSAVSISLTAPPTINIKTQPADLTICESTKATFSVDAEVTPTGNIMTYQWKLNGVDIDDDGHYVGARTSFLTIENVKPSDAGNYSVIIKTATANVVKVSGDAKLTVKLKPVITLQSVAKISAKAQGSFEIFVNADGQAPLTYQWFLNGTEITGETEALCKKDNVDQSAEGVYTCKVTNECGETTSRDITVMITQKNYMNVDEINPDNWGLMQNSPNPFSGKSIITYVVPNESNIKISVTDVFGKELVVLVNKKASMGVYDLEYNPAGMNISAGIYYYTLQADGFTETRKMVFVK